MWNQDDTLQAIGGQYGTLKALGELRLNGEDRPAPPLRQFPSGSPCGPHFPYLLGDEYGKDLQAIRNIADENAVREFLYRSAKFEPDIVEAIIKEGGVSKLAIFTFIKVEDL